MKQAVWLAAALMMLLPLGKVYSKERSEREYNPQNEMFRLLGTKRSFSQNETFFFSHP